MRSHWNALRWCALAPLLLSVGCVSHGPPEGDSVEYLLHVPKSVTDPAPLVIVLHRLGQSAEAIMKRSEMNEVADREGFVVVYPRGEMRYWAAFDAQERDDVTYVLEVIEEVAVEIEIDRSRIYLTGASIGGFMTYRLACLRPDVFAAAAPVMALMPASLSRRIPNGDAIPMMIIHGTADPIVGEQSNTLWAGTRYDVLPMEQTIQYWVRRNGARAQAKVTAIPDRDPDDGTRTERREHAGAAPVVYLRIEGGGHTWPGGTEFGARIVVGRLANDFSASEAIWEFFRDRRRMPNAQK